MAKKEKSLFWASYADLMTSLFFVMLVLFIVAIVSLTEERNQFEQIIGSIELQNENIKNDLNSRIIEIKNRYEASEREKKLLQEINDATKNIDSTYFDYIEEYRKHKLKIEVNYDISEVNIDKLSLDTQNQLKAAGEKLLSFVKETTSQNSAIQYLLIIEGQASKLGPESINYPLSYQRAYELKKFWEDNGIIFTANNCEVLICGSGDGRQSGTGLMREVDEKLNQRFLIHILPKPGQTNETKTSNSNVIIN